VAPAIYAERRPPVLPRLNRFRDQHEFEWYVERLCRGSTPPTAGRGWRRGRYFRLLLIGYFEGLDAERAIAWRAADSFALREFLGLVWPPTRRRITRRSRARDG
jgi:hypothetical protein